MVIPLFGVNVLTLLSISSVLHISAVASKPCKDVGFLVARFLLVCSLAFVFFMLYRLICNTFLDFV